MKIILLLVIFTWGSFASFDIRAVGPGNKMQDGSCLYKHNGIIYSNLLPVDGECPAPKIPPDEETHQVLKSTAIPVLNASALHPHITMIDTHGCIVTVEHLPGGDPDF